MNHIQLRRFWLATASVALVVALLPGCKRVIAPQASAIILIVPMCLLCGITAVWARHMDNNIFTQIGFVVLAGMSVKNAVLIVEFAKQQQEQHRGMKAAVAAIEAARLRLRPILMTSFAFIFGVIPLIIATGAGAEMRQALGTVVFFGMLGVTLFGVFLTPVFYTAIRRLTGYRIAPSERPVRSILSSTLGDDRSAVGSAHL